VIVLPRAVRVYFATTPVNLHKSFDGLANEVRSVLAKDPLSGHVFVFVNRRKNQAKLLMWTRGGFTIEHQRLEQRHVRVLGAPPRRCGQRRDRRARALDVARGHRREAGAEAMGASVARACGLRVRFRFLRRGGLRAIAS
jgi:transposase